MNHFPISVDRIRKGLFKPTGLTIDVDKAMKEGSWVCYQELAGRVSYQENVRKFLGVLSIECIIAQELMCRILGEMVTYAEEYNETEVSDQIIELTNLSFWFIYGIGWQIQPYIDEARDDPEQMKKEREGLMLKADHIYRYTTKYLDQLADKWKDTPYFEAIPSLRHVKQVRENIHKIFYDLSTEGMVPDTSFPFPFFRRSWVVGGGHTLLAYKKFHRMLDENDPLDLMNLLISSYHTMVSLCTIVEETLTITHEWWMYRILPDDAGVLFSQLPGLTKAKEEFSKTRPTQLNAMHPAAVNEVMSYCQNLLDRVVYPIKMIYEAVEAYEFEEQLSIFDEIPVRIKEFEGLFKKVQEVH